MNTAAKLQQDTSHPGVKITFDSTQVSQKNKVITSSFSGVNAQIKVL